MAAAGVWVVATLLWALWPVEHGLRAQYFPNGGWIAPPAETRVDADVSTARLYQGWRAAPPETFSVQWSGYLYVPDGGTRTFTIDADDTARLYVDDQLVAELDGAGASASQSADVVLDRGPHRVVLHYAQRGGAYRMEWRWATNESASVPVPSWALSPRSPGTAARLTRWLTPLWWLVSGVLVLLISALGMEQAGVFATRSRALWFAARVTAFVALGWLFFAGATEHARSVNDFKARGDQSGYLWDAQQIYANWHGRTPALLVGERMRMPVYAGYLALLYTPRMSDDEFFVAAKAWNIRLALALMAGLAIVFAWHLPPLVSFNLTLVVAFGYWVFKAGYSQPELLFYFLFFSTFLACVHMFRDHGPLGGLGLAALAGVLAGLTFLTKALIPPFVAVVVGVYGGREVIRFVRARRVAGGPAAGVALRRLLWRGAAAVAMTAAFLAVVYPYIANSKRVFGQYFYNANTTYFIWYDDGATARAIMMPAMDVEGRISLPAEERPSMGQYLRTRSVGEIAARLAGGVQDMVVRSHSTFWYFYFVLGYLVVAGALIASNTRAFAALARRHAALMLFLALYAGVYVCGTALFSSTSGTGTTRFVITHLTPLLFTLSYFFTLQPFSHTRWRLGPIVVSTHGVHVALTVALAVGLAFFWWPRLMTTYGGF